MAGLNYSHATTTVSSQIRPNQTIIKKLPLLSLDNSLSITGTFQTLHQIAPIAQYIEAWPGGILYYESQYSIYK